MPDETNIKDLIFSQKNKKRKKYLSFQTEEELQQKLLQPIKDLEIRKENETQNYTKIK